MGIAKLVSQSFTLRNDCSATANSYSSTLCCLVSFTGTLLPDDDALLVVLLSCLIPNSLPVTPKKPFLPYVFNLFRSKAVHHENKNTVKCCSKYKQCSNSVMS